MNDVKSTTDRYKTIIVLYSINMLNMITYSMCLLHIDSIYHTGVIINTIMVMNNIIYGYISDSTYSQSLCVYIHTDVYIYIYIYI